MVKYCMNLSDEKKETAIKIALESKGNVRKRKIAVPLLMILGIVIIFSSIFLIINSPAILWYVYMAVSYTHLMRTIPSSPTPPKCWWLVPRRAGQTW